MTTPDADITQEHIGIRLKRAREERGLTVSDVASELRIQPDFLNAIEALNTDALPSIGYVLGYVRAYAGFVGLAPQEAVEAYKTDSKVPENLGMRDRPHFVPQRSLKLPKGFFAVVTLMSCAGVLAAWYGSKTDAYSAAVAGTPALATAGNVQQAAAVLDPNMMLLTATAPSWVKITDADGKAVVSRIFVADETWQGDIREGYSLSVRDSGAVELTVGDNTPITLGQKGVAAENVPMPQGFTTPTDTLQSAAQ